MTPDVLARAFDPFFTTKEPGKGSGLGLSQVYGLARQSGGGVRIDTQIGAGTEVKLYLPRTEAIRVPAAIAAVRPSIQAPAGQPIHVAADGAVVLLVDDDQSVRILMANMLAELGYKVIATESGRAGLEQLAEAPRVDLLLVDYAMPEMNGAETAQRARLLRPDLPVVFVTGYAPAALLGAEPWIVQKPFRLAELAAKLSTALGGGVERALEH
jgi:CheY-like chemotaxis protein